MQRDDHDRSVVVKVHVNGVAMHVTAYFERDEIHGDHHGTALMASNPRYSKMKCIVLSATAWTIAVKAT